MTECSVLLVDDEAIFLETLAKRLARRGLAVHTAGSGKDALEVLAAHPVDVVLLDVKMPGLDGMDTLSLIKRDHPGVEVIMLTGHANVDAAMRGMEEGAFDYLMKPADIDDLFHKIEDAFRKRQLMNG